MGSLGEHGWTLVQHSGYGYANKPGFEHGLETRMIETKTQRKQIVKLGGVIFATYGQAEDAAETFMYPDGVEGMYPKAQGTFADFKVDGLRLYLPVREVVG